MTQNTRFIQAAEHLQVQELVSKLPVECVPIATGTADWPRSTRVPPISNGKRAKAPLRESLCLV